MGRILSQLFFCLILMSSGGCGKSNPAEQLLDDYLTRLARVLKQTKPEIIPSELPRLPPPAELQQTLAPVRIDLVDYWAFRQCGLTLVLSERNSTALYEDFLEQNRLHVRYWHALFAACGSKALPATGK